MIDRFFDTLDLVARILGIIAILLLFPLCIALGAWLGEMS